MDRLGSLVWMNCNEKNTVKQILAIIKKEFPDEEKIDKRLFFVHPTNEKSELS